MSILSTHGYSDEFSREAESLNAGIFTGLNLESARVTSVHRDSYSLITETGAIRGILKKNGFTEAGILFPVIGDFVLIRREAGNALIYRVLRRRTEMSRLDPAPGGGAQIMAANFDLFCVVTSLNRDFNIRRIERYITAGWQSGAQPLLILTKADLSADREVPESEAASAAPGVPLITVSARTGEGLEELRALLRPGKTALLLGSSGVGKSSLINALTGAADLKVQEVREVDSKGRHTTTVREMITLPNGSHIIDTPGIRELGLRETQTGLQAAFPEIEALLGGCRFTDCAHGSEPGCAINAALQDGRLELQRWQRYQKLLKESEFNSDPAAYQEKRRAFWKNIAKQNR